MSQPFNFCPKCGTENSEGDPYCRLCGYGEDPPPPPVGLGDEPHHVDVGPSEVKDRSKGSSPTGPRIRIERDPMTCDYVLREQVLVWKKDSRKILRQTAGRSRQQIELTPYGLAVVLGIRLLDIVLADPEPVRQRFQCEPDELLEAVVHAAEESLFSGINRMVPAHEYEPDPNCKEYDPSDMILHLHGLLRFPGSPPGPGVTRVAPFLKRGLNFSDDGWELDSDGVLAAPMFFFGFIGYLFGYLDEMDKSGLAVLGVLYE